MGDRNVDSKKNTLLAMMANEGHGIISKDVDLKQTMEVGVKPQAHMAGVSEMCKKKLACNVVRDAAKSFVVSPNEFDELLCELGTGNLTQEAKEGFLATLLLIIFMEQYSTDLHGAVSERKLWDILEDFGMEKLAKHPILGDLTHLLAPVPSAEFVAGGWLTVLKEKDGETTHVFYEWGPRAFASVDAMKLLKFYCENIDTSTPKEWPIHYKMAKEIRDAQKTQNKNDE